MRNVRVLAVIGVALAAAVVFTHGDPLPDAHAAAPAATGRIAFADVGGISTANPDGSDIQPITSGLDYWPAWSPDGTKIAFARVLSQEQDGTHWEIFVADADGQHAQLVADAGDFPEGGVSGVDWSPDGAKIVYGGVTILSTNPIHGDYDIYQVDAAGTTPPANMTDTPAIGEFFPKYSPDGAHIVYSGRQGNQMDLYISSSAGGAGADITNTPQPDEWMPDWSPDGASIAYVSLGGDLYTTSASGGAGAVVVTGLNTTPPSWSPDGTQIIYESSGGIQDYTVKPGGTAATLSLAGRRGMDWGGVCVATGGANDADKDGLTDDIEQHRTHTDPCKKDTDGDGLLDPWEVDPSVKGAGFDVDGDGKVDVFQDEVFGPYQSFCADVIGPRREPSTPYCALNHPPDPLHKDVYVEIDWQDCWSGNCPELVGIAVDPSHHAPNVDGLGDAVAAFANAPVDNPDHTQGVNLNILIDERLTHTPNCDQGSAPTRPSNFGTPQQRANPQAIKAKEMAVRYVWSGHSSAFNNTPGECPLPGLGDMLLQGFGLEPLPYYDLSPMGYATPGGSDVLVTLAVSWVCQLYSFDLPAQLGEAPPCYRIGGPGLFPAEIAVKNSQQTVDWPQPIQMDMGVPPSEGVRDLWGQSIMYLLGRSLGVADANLNNNPGAPGGVRAQAYSNWDGLLYAPPHVQAPSSLGSVGTQGVDPGLGPLPDPGLAQQDGDGDGVIEAHDNCPGIANPDQADLDHDGLGDACDTDMDGDGIPNVPDAMPGDTNNNGVDNATDTDDDGDGVADVTDNCPLLSNSDQFDVDADHTGDACDPDADGDGLPNGLETIMGSDPLSAASVPEFLSYNGSCSDSTDNDGDGQTDGADTGCMDADGDTVPDLVDNCAGVSSENILDSDSDGKGDACDPHNVSGDVDCNGSVGPADVMTLLRSEAGLTVTQTQPCDAIGYGIPANGDVDCSGGWNLIDLLDVDKFLAGIDVGVPQGCRDIGS